MARGIKGKRVVDSFIKEFSESNAFLQSIIPCIIPANEEDAKILATGYKMICQIDQFVKECDGDLAELDEIFDIDKIVEEYPKIRNMFSSTENQTDMVSEYIDIVNGDDTM